MAQPIPAVSRPPRRYAITTGSTPRRHASSAPKQFCAQQSAMSCRPSTAGKENTAAAAKAMRKTIGANGGLTRSWGRGPDGGGDGGGGGGGGTGTAGGG
jgi:hypothetical protein